MVLWGAVLCLVLYMFGYSGVVPGLAAGIAASMANGLLLSHQLKKSAQLPMHKAVSYIQAGWLVRLLLVIALLILSVLVAEINFLAALAGFFMFQAVMIVKPIVAYVGDSMSRRKRKERGE